MQRLVFMVLLVMYDMVAIYEVNRCHKTTDVYRFVVMNLGSRLNARMTWTN